MTTLNLGPRWGPADRLRGFIRDKVHRRHLLFPTILIAHLVILAILLLNARSVPETPRMGSPLAMFDVSGPSQQAVAPKPVVAQIVLPDPIVKLEVETEIPVAEPVFDLAAASQAGFGTTCAIAQTLGKAFEGNPLLRSALERWGPEARSVSNAIMVWDGAWVSPEPAIDPAALALVRRGVIEGIKAAPPECREPELTGPEFILIRDAAGSTTVLVLGSGTWTWDKVVLHDVEYQKQELLAPSRQASEMERAANLGKE